MRTLSCFALVAACGLALSARAADPSLPNPSEIVVDRDCRMAWTDLRDPAKPHVRHYHDDGICRIEGGVRRSMQWEKRIINGSSKGFSYEVVEREFLLHNPYSSRVTFIVNEQIDKRYRIDSEPAPNAVAGSVATFRVIAEPNQTVRLHVGERD